MSVPSTRNRIGVALGTLTVVVVSGALTSGSWPLAPAYVAIAAILGAVTGALTRRMSPGWSSTVSVVVIVVVLDRVSETYYAGAPLWSGGMWQAIFVGVGTFGLFSQIADFLLERLRPAGEPVAEPDNAR